MSDSDTPNGTSTPSVAPAVVNVTPAPAPVVPVPAPVAPVNPVVQNINTDVTKVATSLEDKLRAWLLDVYSSNKFLFYTVIPLMGLIYVIIKYHNLLIAFLIKNSKSVLQDQQSADAQAAQKANQAQAAADALVQQADNLPSQQPPVDEDWYTKK